MPKITFTSGSVELLEFVDPLWEKLNDHHAEVSTWFGEVFAGFSFERRKKSLLSQQKGRKLHVGLAKDAEKDVFVGYCISSVKETDTGLAGEIESIFVEPDYRNKNIGEQLMTNALEWLEHQGVARKFLVVACGNERVFSFYERFGFYPKTVKLDQIRED